MRKLKFWKRSKPPAVPSARSGSSWAFPRARTTAGEPGKAKGDLRIVDIPGPSWNRLSSQEESTVLEAALEYTDLSSRQLAAWITDNQRLFRLRIHGVSTSPALRTGQES